MEWIIELREIRDGNVIERREKIVIFTESIIILGNCGSLIIINWTIIIIIYRGILKKEIGWRWI